MKPEKLILMPKTITPLKSHAVATSRPSHTTLAKAWVLQALADHKISRDEAYKAFLEHGWLA